MRDWESGRGHGEQRSAEGRRRSVRMRGAAAAGFECGDGWRRRKASVERSVAVGRGDRWGDRRVNCPWDGQ